MQPPGSTSAFSFCLNSVIFCRALVASLPLAKNALHSPTSTCNQRHPWVSLRLHGFKRVEFRKTLPFKSYGVKKPLCKCVRTHREPFSRSFGTNETQQLLEGQLVGREASYWCNRRETPRPTRGSDQRFKGSNSYMKPSWYVYKQK